MHTIPRRHLHLWCFIKPVMVIVFEGDSRDCYCSEGDSMDCVVRVIVVMVIVVMLMVVKLIIVMVIG